MNDFKFMIPQTIEFGVGALKKLPEIMKENDLDHVFLISDHGLEALGVVKKIQDIVEEAGLQCTTWTSRRTPPPQSLLTLPISTENAALPASSLWAAAAPWTLLRQSA